MVSPSVAEQTDHIFQDEEVVAKITNLSSVTIKLLQDGTDIPGVYYYMIKRISWQGINVIEVISTTNEHSYLVDEIDVEKTFSILKNLNNLN